MPAGRVRIFPHKVRRGDPCQDGPKPHLTAATVLWHNQVRARVHWQERLRLKVLFVHLLNIVTLECLCIIDTVDISFVGTYHHVRRQDPASDFLEGVIKIFCSFAGSLQFVVILAPQGELCCCALL